MRFLKPDAVSVLVRVRPLCWLFEWLSECSVSHRTVPDIRHENYKFLILNLINDAVVTDASCVKAAELTRQSLSKALRVITQSMRDVFNNRGGYFLGQVVVQRPPGCRTPLNFVTRQLFAVRNDLSLNFPELRSFTGSPALQVREYLVVRIGHLVWIIQIIHEGCVGL